MMPQFIEQVDWHRPWLAPLHPIAKRVLQAQDWRTGLNVAAEMQGLRNHRGLPIRFVPQAALPPGVAYEEFISTTGGIPTRENLHDFFNALVWLRFPAIKIQLNALQAAEIARIAGNLPEVSSRNKRGAVRDGATIFDENAALFITQNSGLANALRSRQWRDVFVGHRTSFGSGWDVMLFGHALMEKLVNPFKAITAHAWILPVEQEFFLEPLENRVAIVDDVVAKQLGQGLSTSYFAPLPVIGVPDWWSGQDDGFYNDSNVFRPPRDPVR
jgi:hypothetical protein